MRRFIGMAVAAVVVLAACGSSGGSDGASSSTKGAAYVAAIMKNYDKSSAQDVFTRAQAECIAKGMVDAVGVDKLESVGTPAQLSGTDNPFQSLGKQMTPAEAQEVVNVITDGRCFDFTKLVIKSATQGGDSPFGKLSKEQINCFFDKLLAKRAFKQAMADSILGRDSSSDAFTKAFSNQSEVFKLLGDCKIKPSQLNG
jgi:hypothetical protein